MIHQNWKLASTNLSRTFHYKNYMKIWDKYHFITVASFRIFEQLLSKTKIMGVSMSGVTVFQLLLKNSPFWKLHSIVNIALVTSKPHRMVDMSLYYILNFVL